MSSINRGRKRGLYIAGAVAIPAMLMFGFVNCSQVRFEQLAGNTSNSMSSGGPIDPEVDPTLDACPSKFSTNAISVSQEDVGEGHVILGYKLGEISCHYTSFLVEVKAYGLIESFLAFRNNHATGKNELISVNEQGYPQFIYPYWFSTTADESAVIYMPHKIVDRSPTPIVPENLVRRDIKSGKIEIINQYSPNSQLAGHRIDLAVGTQPYKYFHHKVGESRDGRIVLLQTEDRKLIRKDLNTGSTLDLTVKHYELEAGSPQFDAVRSFSMSADGSKSLFVRTLDNGQSILFLSSGSGKGASYPVNLLDSKNSYHDGFDLKHRQHSIISADGKYAFFSGKTVGGRPYRESIESVVRLNLETKDSEIVSIVEPGDGAENHSIPNARIQSVSADGRYACFLATRNHAVNADMSEPIHAYVKDMTTKAVTDITEELEGGVSAVSCSINENGKSVAIEINASIKSLAPVLIHKTITW